MQCTWLTRSQLLVDSVFTLKESYKYSRSEGRQYRERETIFFFFAASAVRWFESRGSTRESTRAGQVLSDGKKLFFSLSLSLFLLKERNDLLIRFSFNGREGQKIIKGQNCICSY